jgi:outer membrane protein assembly factor BamE (lipoprotein component of BamABCDE complex)
MKFPHCLRIILLFTASMLGLGLAGCIATNSSNTNIAGRTVSDDVFTQIQPGKSRDFVLSLLGEPTKKIAEENGSEIWEWNYVETKITERTFIILFVAVDRTNTTQMTTVEFKDGVVTKAWRE